MEKRKFRRRQWHTRNRMAVFAHFKGVCQVCNVEISTKWDVHHLSYDYKKSVYAYDADELISNGIITLICRKCHNGVHTIGDVDDRKPFENMMACEVCKKIERGIFDRRNYEALDKYLCRQCYLNHKRGVTQLSLF